MAALVVAFVVNVALIAFEDLPAPARDQTIDAVSPVGQLVYTPENRTQNLQVMGLDPALVNEANRQMSAMEDQRDRLRLLLEAQTAVAGRAFCGQALPPPYAALSVLVVQDNDRRSVLGLERLARFEPAAFYDPQLVTSLHDRFEFADPRKEQATVMAVGAVLTRREADALTGGAPFSLGLGGWGLRRLEALDPTVRPKLATYVAMMHVLTELATEPGRGICR